MKIGVVCEGPTDFIAIEAFCRHSLAHHGVTAEFVAVQPEKDKSSPEGGWGNVFTWLKENPPEVRIKKYFEGSLFEGGLAKSSLDCLLIHLDTDVLGEEGFEKYVREKFMYVSGSPREPVDRALEISNILKLSWRDQDMANVDKCRHVPAVSVESTENWCVAAFCAKSEDVELLSGQKLIDQFMSALETSERRKPNTHYTKIDKNIKRRQRFCDRYECNSQYVYSRCRHFKLILKRLLSLSRNSRSV